MKNKNTYTIISEQQMKAFKDKFVKEPLPKTPKKK